MKKTNNQSIPTSVQVRSLLQLREKTGNVYESIAIVSKRANQISAQIKEELHSKLEEFASVTDNLEEVHENREQIEISRAYEKLPHPTIQATQEYTEEKIYYRNPSKEEVKPLV